MTYRKHTSTRKYSVHVGQRRTSISLEPEFWVVFTRMAQREHGQRHGSINATVTKIEAAKPSDVNLSSAVRLYVLNKGEAQNDRS